MPASPHPARRGVMARLLPTLAAAVLATDLASVSAHHSFSAEYLADHEITLKGQVVSFQFRNPHCSLQIAAPDEKGRMTQWFIEWGGPSQLKGFSRDTLKAGDRVVVTAYPSRVPDDHRLRMKTFSRPSDGLWWGGYSE